MSLLTGQMKSFSLVVSAPKARTNSKIDFTGTTLRHITSRPLNVDSHCLDAEVSCNEELSDDKRPRKPSRKGRGSESC